MPSLPTDQALDSKVSPQLVIDERKRKRMLSNRLSARRSRVRKQQQLDDLIKQSTDLKNLNSKIEMQINCLTQHYLKVDSENTVLRVRLSELTERLQSMNSILHVFEQVGGMAIDIPEIPETLLKPWKIPCQPQPISATVNMFQF